MQQLLLIAVIKHKLHKEKIIKMPVNGVSMHPLLAQDDIVYIESLDDYKIGDILIYGFNNEGILIHRLINKFNGFYFCKGDNTYRIEQITSHDIIGKAVLCERDGVYININYGKIKTKILCILSKMVNQKAEKNNFNVPITQKSIVYKFYKKFNNSIVTKSPVYQ